MILNNCTTCGRKPQLKTYGVFIKQESLPKNLKGHAYSHYYVCKCEKAVISRASEAWSSEVAADMWNLANPQEEYVGSDIINRIAHDLAVCAVKVDISNGKLKFMRYDNCGFSESLVLSRIVNAQQYERELTEFYKKRLKPGVKV